MWVRVGAVVVVRRGVNEGLGVRVGTSEMVGVNLTVLAEGMASAVGVLRPQAVSSSANPKSDISVSKQGFKESINNATPGMLIVLTG